MENNVQGEADSFPTVHKLILFFFPEARAEVVQLGSVPVPLKLEARGPGMHSTPPCVVEMENLPSTFSHSFLRRLNDLPTEYQRDVG